MSAPKEKKAARLCKKRTAFKNATHMHNNMRTINFIAACAGSASAAGFFCLKPGAGIGQSWRKAPEGCDTVNSGASNTLEYAGNLPDSEVFSRPKFEDGPKFRRIYGFGRDGLVREAGRMAYSMLLTSRPPVARSKAASGLQSQYGARTMTTVNTPTTPTSGNTSPLTRQQAIESALSDALHLLRTTGTQHGIHAATGRAIRAASMLKQACAELQIGGAA